MPNDYREALCLDEEHGNVKWQDAMNLKMQQLKEFESFMDASIYGKDPPPEGYKKIRARLIFDVKHDGRNESRLVAGGHLTNVPINSIYSDIVSLRGLRMVTFLSKVNNLELWATNIGNAYLKALMAECIYLVAGPEFGELEGHMLIIYKALYGLHSSRLRWHLRFLDCLRGMGFTPSKAEIDIWMQHVDDHNKYLLYMLMT